MSQPTIEAFTDDARAWLDEHAIPRPQVGGDAGVEWGKGDFSVAVFHSLQSGEERSLIERLKAWTMLKATCGYHAITQPREYGGLGLDRSYARAFSKLEALY